MSTFHYRALQRTGVMIEGDIEATSRDEACRLLDGRGLTPVSVTGAAQPAFTLNLSLPAFEKKKIPHRALLDFTHMLSNLLAAGVSLSRALQILAGEDAKGPSRARWRKLREKVVDGWSLADAMATSPDVFSPIYVAMVRAGEMGGFLDVVLAQIAELQERDRELRSRVASAMIYPVILIVLAIGVLIFLLVFFIPRFESIFAGFDAALPLITRVIVGMSQVAQSYWLLAAMGIVGIIASFRAWLRSSKCRRQWSAFVLAAPVIGPLQARFAMSRFCRMFGTLAGAGVPLIEALRVAKEAIGNEILTATIDGAIDQVRKGASLATGLRACPAMFPTTVIEMVGVAEETGRLDKEFVRIAANAERDLDRRLRAAVSMAEPLILLLIATLVGVIFIGMVLPIFSLQDYIN